MQTKANDQGKKKKKEVDLRGKCLSFFMELLKISEFDKHSTLEVIYRITTVQVGRHL